MRVRLHAYGEDKRLLPRDSERALTVLFEHVAHVAIRQRRTLTREDFRVLFDDSTRVNVPLSQFNEMLGAAASLQPTLPSATEVDYSIADTALIPDLPIPCAPRTESLDMLATCVIENKFVAIQGSTGKGKSTLAKLLARRLKGNWLWLSIANRTPQQISDELYRLSRQVAASPHAPSLLVDDFNPKGADFPALLQRLAVLSRLTFDRGGRMIVTTQRLFGDAFLRQSNLPSQVLQVAPGFLKEEVQGLCIQSGCPNDSRLAPWRNIIFSQTSGHPLLVHARIKVATRRGWPSPNINDILETPQEISDERQLARQLLQELDDGEIQLLDRLSVASQAFRKDHAVAVGEIDPPIARPGDKFDALVGPWIEPAAKTYFRLSPLLAQPANGNWTPESAKAMRINYARAVLRTKDLTIREASEILFQSVLTKEAALAAPVLASLTVAPIESRMAIAPWLDWMLVLPEPSSIFPDNRFVTYLFALVQFRVAAGSRSSSAPMFAERLFKAARKPVAREVDNFRMVGAAMDILLAMDVLAPPELLLQCWFSILKLSEEDPRLTMITRGLEKSRTTLGHVPPDKSFSEIAFSFVLYRRGGRGYLHKFVAAVDALLPEPRRRVIAAITLCKRFIHFYGPIAPHRECESH